MNKSAERAADIITAATEEFKIGEKSYTLKPRTLFQMRAISKAIARYSDGLYVGVEALNSKKEEELKPAVDKILDMPYDHIITIIQMFLDENREYDSETPIVTADSIEKMDMREITNLIDKIFHMHNVEDLLKKISGLRVV